MNGNHQAKCLICGREGKGKKDFICESCGDPEKIIFHCGRCGDIREFSKDALIELMKGSNVAISIEPGLVIRSSYCDKCHRESDKGGKARVDFWKITGEIKFAKKESTS